MIYHSTRGGSNVQYAAKARDRAEDMAANISERRTEHTTPHFFPASAASPFLHAMILIFWQLTISFDSILKFGFVTMKVQTSSHSRYVFK